MSNTLPSEIAEELTWREWFTAECFFDLKLLSELDKLGPEGPFVLPLGNPTDGVTAELTVHRVGEKGTDDCEIKVRVHRVKRATVNDDNYITQEIALMQDIFNRVMSTGEEGYDWLKEQMIAYNKNKSESNE